MGLGFGGWVIEFLSMQKYFFNLLELFSGVKQGQFTHGVTNLWNCVIQMDLFCC